MILLGSYVLAPNLSTSLMERTASWSLQVTNCFKDIKGTSSLVSPRFQYKQDTSAVCCCGPIYLFSLFTNYTSQIGNLGNSSNLVNSTFLKSIRFKASYCYTVRPYLRSKFIRFKIAQWSKSIIYTS